MKCFTELETHYTRPKAMQLRQELADENEKMHTESNIQWRHLSQPLGGLTFPSSYSTTTSLRLLSPCYVMCDMPKNVSIELAAILLYHQKKTLQTVTVTVMVNNCTKISIFDMSSVETKKSAFSN